MENNQENQVPEPTSNNKGGFGPVLGIIVIIILLALGGLYYFTTGINKIPSYNENDGTINALEEQSSSDAISDIEADLNATDLSEVDTLLEDINADLEQI